MRGEAAKQHDRHAFAQAPDQEHQVAVMREQPWQIDPIIFQVAQSIPGERLPAGPRVRINPAWFTGLSGCVPRKWIPECPKPAKITLRLSQPERVRLLRRL